MGKENFITLGLIAQQHGYRVHVHTDTNDGSVLREAHKYFSQAHPGLALEMQDTPSGLEAYWKFPIRSGRSLWGIGSRAQDALFYNTKQQGAVTVLPFVSGNTSYWWENLTDILPKIRTYNGEVRQLERFETLCHQLDNGLIEAVKSRDNSRIAHLWSLYRMLVPTDRLDSKEIIENLLEYDHRALAALLFEGERTLLESDLLPEHPQRAKLPQNSVLEEILNSRP